MNGWVAVDAPTWAARLGEVVAEAPPCPTCGRPSLLLVFDTAGQAWIPRADSDGLGDGEEIVRYRTDPLDPDSLPEYFLVSATGLAGKVLLMVVTLTAGLFALKGFNKNVSASGKA